MKKQLFYSLILMFLGTLGTLNAQIKDPEKNDPNFFNETLVIKEAQKNGIKASEMKSYVNAMKLRFSSEQQLKKQAHKHLPYENGAIGAQETVIYLTPKKIASAGCPNMGFENYNFSGWTGETGNVSTGTSSPNYATTGSLIVNSGGTNVNEKNLSNYHTILTIPPTNPNGPGYFAAGYDTNATKLVGSAHISQIPLVSPYSFDGVSTRMLGQHANNEACKLKYITTTSATNKQLVFSYAVVLEDPSGHAAGESPYFRVEVRNETTGLLLPGCTSYTFNPKSTVASDSLFLSSHEIAFDPVKYRKWQLYSVDLSSLPLGTNVSLNFEVGGCTLGGHVGYAYVDAECGGLGSPYVNMCGSSFATLVAPAGYNQYQWFELPANTPISGATNDTLIIPSVTTNTLYAVQMVSPGGCTLTLTDTIKATTVKIININSSASCAGGNSGSANVVANGSNGIYTYTWTNTSTGAVVSNQQNPTNLAAGNYSVVVASTSCGLASAVVSVPTAPPFYLTQTKSFCGTSTYIAKAGGSNYTWYYGSGSTATVIPAPNGTNDTLRIQNAVDGDFYTLVYTTSSGCKDSVRFTLSLIPGGSAFTSNVQNVCPGGANGFINVNLYTPFSAPYSYNVVGPTGVVANVAATTSTFIPVSNLSVATYTYLIDDGVCLYNGTFSINPIQTNFTITPTNSVVCFPVDAATLNMDFGSTVPSCGLDPSVCSGAPTTLFPSGPFVSNSSTNYPSPYSGWWYSGKHQFLIRASDLNAAGIQAGKISSLAFKITNLNSSPLNYPDYQIKMACTNLNALPTGVAPFVTGLTQVYFNANQPINNGWNTYNFNQSYLWDGVQNLIVEVCTGGLTTFPANASIELKQMPYVANMKTVSFSNGVSSCPDLNSGNGTYMTNGQFMLPNMQFGYCQASLPASAYTVSISSNGTITANYNNDSLKVSPTFTPSSTNPIVIYTITVVNPIGGCVKTETVAINYPSGKLNVSAIANPTIVCEGSTSNLNAFGGVNYQWYYGQPTASNTIATMQSISVTPPMVGNNTYYVIGGSSCAGTIPDTASVIVNVTPKANLVIAPLADVTKCINKNYVISTGVGSTTSGNNGTPYSYNWTTLPSGNPAPGVNTSANYTVTSNTTTTLVVTVNGNCANPTKDTIVIKNFIDDLSLAVINTATVCSNSELNLNSIANGGKPNYNFTWFLEPAGSVISTSQNLNTTSPGSEGTYTVTVRVIDSCEYIRTTTQIFTVLPPCDVVIPNVMSVNNDGINDVFIIKNLQYHPNTSVTIYDRWGRKVYENANYQNDWRADGLSDGTFFYVIDVPDDKKYNSFITIFHGK